MISDASLSVCFRDTALDRKGWLCETGRWRGHFLRSLSPPGTTGWASPAEPSDFPSCQPKDANRHLIVVMGRREEGKRQAAKYSNSKGLCLRRWHKWSASDNSVRYAQGETGKKYNPERALRNLQDEKEKVKPRVEKAPCRTGGMTMGRRLVMVYKVITCLLISNIAFPRILLGISRLHVHGWSWELTNRAVSGWKPSPELAAGWSQASRLSQPELSSFAAKPCLDYLALLASCLPRIVEPCWHNQSGWLGFILVCFGVFLLIVRRTHLFFQTHTV